MPEPVQQLGVVSLANEIILNRRRLPNGMILCETGLLQMGQKKRQAVRTFRVALRCLVADAISMAIKSHDHSVSRTSQGHKPIRAGKLGATL